MVLYIEPSKEDWYTENSQKLFTALQPVILQHLVGGEQGKPITRQNRKLETPKILSEGKDKDNKIASVHFSRHLSYSVYSGLQSGVSLQVA